MDAFGVTFIKNDLHWIQGIHSFLFIYFEVIKSTALSLRHIVQECYNKKLNIIY